MYGKIDYIYGDGWYSIRICPSGKRQDIYPENSYKVNSVQ
jgi:hypothetical protein